MLALMTHDPTDSTDPRVALLLEFVNTNDVEGGNDDLGSPRLMRAWLARRGLDEEPEVDAASHERALAVREGIRALGLANNGDPMDLARLAGLNAATASAPLVVTLAPGLDDPDWHLAGTGRGADRFVGDVVAALTSLMADGTFSRLKACRSDTCRWLFLDQSRNRSGTWCSMRTCGSRMKARTYRARQRESATA
jgi:predicted RNA-binding Zn ribbon-like protein